MLIRSPPNLHYPITVVELLKNTQDEVKRFAPLFSYTYESTVTEGNKWGDEVQVKKNFPGRFDSSLDGVVAAWFIKKGTVINRSGVDLLDIEEPCSHDIQFGGLCTNCGMDMTETDYVTDARNSDRATVNMTHDNVALLVSRREAHQAEGEARRRLLGVKKLSLIVDLDQTIIHTTCERTVAEWQADKNNPNYDAVKDVKSFQLADDKLSNVAGNWYYCKLRPGLQEFLERVSAMYELHIYTMATRAYAQAVAKIIDPERKFFGDRILSRDENGTDQIKTLHRLFPTNTDMVVIIDDRGDIWHWSDNLIRVRQYNFFLGAGDINASFLPKQQELVPTAPPTTLVTTVPPIPKTDKQSDEEKGDITRPFSVAAKPAESEVVEHEEPEAGAFTELEQQLISMTGGDNPQVLEEQVKEQEKVIISQQTERPLLQKQLLLDQADEAAEEEVAAENGDTQSTEHHKQRHSLLHDDDRELERIEVCLRRVHEAFYEEYQRRNAGPQVGRVAELRGSPKKRNVEESGSPDVKTLMPEMKRSVLSGASIVFSGIIPLGMDVQFSDIALWAKSFGARVSLDITKQTTHVVANPSRKTNKVKKAARYPHIKIVTTDWLLECFSQWERVPEDPYLIEMDPADQTDSGPLEDLEDGPLLSGEGEDNDDEILEIGDEVPIDMSDEKWQSLGDEFQDFMDGISDTDEETNSSDTESVRSELSTQSTSSHKPAAAITTTSTNTTNNKKKRKRTGTPSADASEAETDSDASVSSTAGGSSRLQRRKKRVLERVTSLTNVVSAEKSSGLPSPETTGPEEDQAEEVEKNGDVVGDDVEGEGEEDDGLEAEMLAELQKAADEDDDAGDE
jgi:RNA polymerase II subunit A-like phosphatase